MFLNQRAERFVEHQLGNCRSLRAALEDTLLVVAGLTRNALGLNESRTRVKVQSKLQVKRRVIQLLGRLDEMVQLDSVIKAGEICQASDRVDALVLANLCFEHSPDRDAETIFVRSGMIPGHVIVQSQLPSLKFVLPIGVPQAVQAGGEGNRSLNPLILWDHDNVGVTELKWKLRLLFHLSKKLRELLHCRVWQMT